MAVITLTPEQHARWVAAVAEWPTCQTCDGGGAIWSGEPRYAKPCDDCINGAVPQPVVLVIEGEPAKHVHDRYCAGLDCIQVPEFVPPVGWRVPAGEPVELRAECQCNITDISGNCIDCDDGSVLVARATVELLPVVGLDVLPEQWTRPALVVVWSERQALIMRHDAEAGTWSADGSVDPLPVPGRHWVAICTPVE